MERQSKEASIAIWNIEKESANHITLSDAHKELISVVDNKINDYSLTYDEYVADVYEEFSKFEDTEDIDKRRNQVDEMCKQLIKKYTDGK